MKFRITLLVMVFALAFTSYGQGNKTDLCKKWSIDLEAFMAGLPPEMTSMFAMLPKEQKDAAMKQMEAQFEGLFVQFNADGTMNSVSDKGPVSGTWEFIDGGKAIKTSVEKDTILELVELTSDKLKLKERPKMAGQPEVIIPFMPAKD